MSTFLDTFNRADSADLGAKWASNANFSIANNSLSVAASPDYALPANWLLANISARKNVSVSVEVAMQPGRIPMVITRANSTNGTALMTWIDGSKIHVARIRNGQQEGHVEADVATANGSNYVLSGLAIDNGDGTTTWAASVATLAAPGTPLRSVSMTDNATETQNAGLVGLTCAQGSGQIFDNFKVEDLDSPTFAPFNPLNFSFGVLGESIDHDPDPDDPTSVPRVIQGILATVGGKNRTVNVVNRALPGRAIFELLPQTQLMQDAISALQAANIKYVILTCALNDAARGTATADYTKDLNLLLRYLNVLGFVVVLNDPTATNRSDYPNSSIVTYTSVCHAAVNGTTVLQGDEQAYNYFLAHPEELYDNLHQNPLGRQHLGEFKAAAFYASVLQPVDDIIAPTLVFVSNGSDASTVAVTQSPWNDGTQIQLKLDGANYQAPFTLAPSATTTRTVNAENGTIHSVTAIALDATGNASAASNAVTIAPTNPASNSSLSTSLPPNMFSTGATVTQIIDRGTSSHKGWAFCVQVAHAGENQPGKTVYVQIEGTDSGDWDDDLIVLGVSERFEGRGAQIIKSGPGEHLPRYLRGRFIVDDNDAHFAAGLFFCDHFIDSD